MPPRQPSTARQGRASSAISGSWHGPSVRTQSQRRASVPNIGARTSIKPMSGRERVGFEITPHLPLPACGERVGVREPLRWARETGEYLQRCRLACIAQNRGDAPSPSVASLPRPLRTAGRGEGRVTRTISATRAQEPAEGKDRRAGACGDGCDHQKEFWLVHPAPETAEPTGEEAADEACRQPNADHHRQDADRGDLGHERQPNGDK